MGRSDGIEHVTSLPSVLEIRGVDGFASLPTLWRPIGVSKYSKGLLVTRHEPPPTSPEHNAYPQWQVWAMTRLPHCRDKRRNCLVQRRRPPAKCGLPSKSRRTSGERGRWAGLCPAAPCTHYGTSTPLRVPKAPARSRALGGPALSCVLS